MEVLVVGPGGIVGSGVVAALAARGHAVRRFGRADGDARDAAAVAEAARGVEVIANCAGASCLVELGHGWRGYGAVDVPIGLAVGRAAAAVGARVVYVGASHDPALAQQPYIAAHEVVAREVVDGGGAVVRPTGLYASFASLWRLARKTGWLADLGAGTSRTNPIDEADLATIVADVVESARPGLVLDVGGPDVVTRRELFEIIAGAAGRRVRIVRTPAWLGALGGRMLSLVHPRIGQFVRFAAALAHRDAVAPPVGTTRLASYLAALSSPDHGAAARRALGPGPVAGPAAAGN